MGSIIDTRTPAGKPSFLHFFAMAAEEVQQLLLKAYDKQMEVLIQHEVRSRFSLVDVQCDSALTLMEPSFGSLALIG